MSTSPNEPHETTPRPITATPAQLNLLKLIDNGEVATVRHLWGGSAVRITTQRSKGRGGALGRDVTRRARRLAELGLAEETTTVGSPRPWRLTEAGQAARTKAHQPARLPEGS